MATEMKVEINSRESIKPSSPTPNDLQTLKLCFLDQLAGPIYVPVFLTYNSSIGDGVIDQGKVVERLQRLKISLSETLTNFYPLAGSMKDNNDIVIDCNDSGADYIEARVHARLSDFTSEQTNDAVDRLLPCIGDSYGSVLLVIQVNVFDCGGMAIVIMFSHKVADAFSICMFVNGWASAARGIDFAIEKSPQPQFNSALYFPCKVDVATRPMLKFRKDEYTVSKKFLFNANKIASLRANYQSSCRVVGGGKYSTRVEAVSAFIWERFIKVSQAKIRGNDGITTMYAASHAVNLRGKMGIPQNTFGNISRVVYTTPITVEIEELKKKKLPDLVALTRNAVMAFDDDCVKKLQSGHVCPPLIFPANGENMVIKLLRFTSWCRFPFYDADFGWGKPIRMIEAASTFKNLVVLSDTMSGDEIVAVVSLSVEDMIEFERDLELVN